MDCRWTTSRIYLWVQNVQTGGCEVILLWFCSDDYEKWLSADNNLQEHQTKFNDKNFPVESVFAFSHAFGSRTLILHIAELFGKMQIVIVLFILTVMHRPLNYHAIEISSFYSNCFIWEKYKRKKRRRTNYKGDIEIWLGYFIVRLNYGCLWCTYIFFAPCSR